ncbi:MAG TPA: GNAT family N-acetyltransferase [Puia sp.]|jgi:ElaA protein|nr:GNAT family N-acetyltransferase [Puia sp.]
MIWLCKKFDDLTPYELYAILQLRNEVFVVEQDCVFQDADNKDQDSYHLMGWQENDLVAYSRILPPDISYSESSIGRIVTSPRTRKNGIGRELVKQSIAELYILFGKIPIKIGAQMYLQKFYESFGFKQTSDIYLEDDIPHIEMLLQMQ